MPRRRSHGRRPQLIGRVVPRFQAVLATLEHMFAAYVWHYWVGLVLLLAGVGAVLQGVVGYITKVSASRYPNRRQRQIQKKK